MAQRDPNEERVRLKGAIAGGIVLGLAASVVTAVSFGGDADDEAADPAPVHSPSVSEPAAAAGSAASAADDDFEPGSLDPVRVGKASVKPPVGLYQRGSFGTGVTTRITEVEPVHGKARGPGEISGPALRVTVVVSNGSGEQISLPESAVGLTYGSARTPAVPLSKPGVRPFSTVLNKSETATASYVFAVPPDKRRPIRVSVTYSAKHPTLVFKGPAGK